MRILKANLSIIAGAAAFALAGAVSGGAIAEENHGGHAMHQQSGNATHANGQNNFGNKNNFSNKGNFGKNRVGDNHEHNDFGRRHHGRRGYGVSIDLGGDSSCSYAYRRWQDTGSRYWRHRYYDCIG